MNVSITGFSDRGRIFASVLRHHEGLTLTSVCDSEADRLHGVNSVQTYTDHREMMEAEETDLSIIATPPGDRTETVRDSVSFGNDVFIENPTALTVREFDEILSIKEEFDATVSAVQNVRFVPTMRTAEEMVKRGEIGEVVSVDVDWSQEILPEVDNTQEWPSRISTGELAKSIPHIVYPVVGFTEELLSFSVELQRRDLYSDDPTGFALVGTDLDDRIVRSQFVSSCPDTSRKIRVYGSDGRLTVDLDRKELQLEQREKRVTTRPIDTSGVPAPIRDKWSRGHYVMLDLWYQSKEAGESVAPVPLTKDRDVVRVFERVENRWSDEYA